MKAFQRMKNGAWSPLLIMNQVIRNRVTLNHERGWTNVCFLLFPLWCFPLTRSNVAFTIFPLQSSLWPMSRNNNSQQLRHVLAFRWPPCSSFSTVWSKLFLLFWICLEHSVRLLFGVSMVKEGGVSLVIRENSQCAYMTFPLCSIATLFSTLPLEHKKKKRKLPMRKSWGLLGFSAFLRSSHAPLALSLSFDSIEMLMIQRPDQQEPTIKK